MEAPHIPTKLDADTLAALQEVLKLSLEQQTEMLEIWNLYQKGQIPTPERVEQAKRRGAVVVERLQTILLVAASGDLSGLKNEN